MVATRGGDILVVYPFGADRAGEPSKSMGLRQKVWGWRQKV